MGSGEQLETRALFCWRGNALSPPGGRRLADHRMTPGTLTTTAELGPPRDYNGALPGTGGTDRVTRDQSPPRGRLVPSQLELGREETEGNLARTQPPKLE
ncbi:hypothetical protein P7K49_011883 [Saguinus oedipus]|uniref:Uncharacterized protein n=1 Tax=Saguinus oedipus TaxID=9490 RepID=A0ABQ9VRX1_SAGOE|nr:hypothetical protein P7K49_011883 [Saguinus oedipus]